ncbi:hypothetical protein AYI68_g3715 [Smittium mucronatum]|uniref:Uncharacterized protein n=1 Tax=Smittium mucronatum TaxID=133383 RepID=A0A1R0GZ53_9FUNG|nr:hypothetical protein AYI68_g3715 [Smittium mucronatum]
MPYPQDSSENHDLLPDSAHKFDMNVGLGDMLSLHTEVPESWNYLDESANQDSMSSSAKPQPDPTSNRPDLYNDSLANDNSNYNGLVFYSFFLFFLAKGSTFFFFFKVHFFPLDLLYIPWC